MGQDCPTCKSERSVKVEEVEGIFYWECSRIHCYFRSQLSHYEIQDFKAGVETARHVKSSQLSLEGVVAQALIGERGVDQKRIAEQVIKLGSLLLRKNADYGSSAWKRPCLAPDCDAGTAIRVRMSDKVERIRSLLSRKGEPEIDESLNDTLSDLAGYCLLELSRPEDPEWESVTDESVRADHINF